MPRIGWPGAFVLCQTLLMAALFLPGITTVRPVLRVGGYAMGLLFWLLILAWGRAEPNGPRFPARAWLAGCIVWLCVEILHPNSYSLITASAQVIMYVAIMSPAFWAARSMSDSRQLARLLTVIFACNALSVLLGIGQVYRPNTFNPPVIPALNNRFKGEDLMYEADDGRKVLRPCGLSDTPGSAAPAGTLVALIGLSWALQPVAIWKRLGAVLLAFLGIVVIYYSHVRVTIVMLTISLVTLALLLSAQRHYRQATLLVTGATALLVGGMSWAVSTVGSRIFDRFIVLFTQGPMQYSYQSRGGLVEEGLAQLLYYPLGYGLGWWGMIYATFGDAGRMTKVWVEVMVQAWVYDGGLPLLLGYLGAIGVALWSTMRIALRSRDPNVSYWASVVFASNLSVAASCLSYVTFLSPIGMNFWLLSALVYAADLRARPLDGPPKARRRPASPRPVAGGPSRPFPTAPGPA